jgi:hypothetical protein
MRREGSAFQGLGTVILKELSDHMTSARMRVLEWLVLLIAFASLYGAIDRLRDTTVHRRPRAAAVVRRHPGLSHSAGGHRAGLRCHQ